MKEELKELLANPPSEEYLDKLIEALRLWSQVKDKLPDEEFLDNVCYAASPDTQAALERLPEEEYIGNICYAASQDAQCMLNGLPDEDYLDKVIAAAEVDFSEFPNEDELDKIIKARKVSVEDN